MDGIKSLGSAADFFTADVRAAQELGYNTAEYQWVKAQIMEAVGSVVSERVAEATRAAADRQAAELRRKMESAENETERNTYARILETYENNIAGGEGKELDDSVSHNRQLLSEYEDALDTISTELSKYETREGDRPGSRPGTWSVIWRPSRLALIPPPRPTLGSEHDFVFASPRMPGV